MLNQINYVVITLLNSLILTLAINNLVLYPIKRISKISIYVYISLCQLLFYEALGQNIIYFTIAGIVLIVMLSSKNPVLDLAFTLFSYLVSVVTNYLVVAPLNALGITTAELGYNKYSYFIIIVYGLITYFITKYLGNYLRTRVYSLSHIFTKKIRTLILLEILSCVIIFSFNIILEQKGGYPSKIIYFNAILFSIFFIITLIIFFFCLQIMQKNHELMQLQKEKENLSEYMNRLEEQYQNMRIFKHDYINVLSTLKCYIMETNSEELKNYFENKVLPNTERLEVKDISIGRLSNIKVLELKGILYAKLLTAMNLDLKITVEIRDEIHAISMEMIDLSRIIGVFMDNAIEAASVSDEKQLTIALIDSPECVTIIIANSSVEEHIDLDKIYQRDISSKAGHSGIGLFGVSQILNRYPNTIHYTNYKNHTFTQTLEICNYN